MANRLFHVLVLGFAFFCPPGIAADFTQELFTGACQGRFDRVVALLANDVEVNAKIASGRTPLMGAVYFGNYKIARLLIGYGADVNMADNRGVTPLMDAAAAGRDDLVKLLLIAGADPALQDKNGQTALAKAKLNGFDTIIAMLDKGGAAPSQSEENQSTTPASSPSGNAKESQPDKKKPPISPNKSS